MSRPRAWVGRDAVRVCGVVLVVLLAGCLGGGGGGAPAATPTPTTTTTATTMQPATTRQGTPTTKTVDGGSREYTRYGEETEGSRSFPDPPADLTNETAKRVALSYEQVYVFNKLRNQSYGRYGVPSGGEPSATVVNKTATGIYVRVRMPYSYAAGNSYYSNTTRALYRVTTTRIKRVTATGLQLF